MKWELSAFNLDLTALGHTAMDSAETKQTVAQAHKALRKKLETDVGFFNCPVAMEKELPAIREAASELRQHEAAVCLGIGGSHLGALTLIEALRPAADHDAFPLLWGSNFDPPFVEKLRHFSSRHGSLAIVVISKSGNTVETLSGFAEAFKPGDKPYLVTDPQTGELRRLANHYAWPTLEVPGNVGGRYSVLTPVGLLPAAMAGVAIEEVVDGAKTMREELLDFEPEQNPAYLYALSKHTLHTRDGHAIQYLMPYWSSLRTFADWYVQLWAESLGKDGRGPTPAAALGSQDQHSLLQLFKEGPRDKLIGFLNVLDESDYSLKKPAFESPAFSYLWDIPAGRLNRLACDSTQTSLNRSGVPTYRIDVPKLNARAMGALFLFMETACAFAAELYGVDAFDQPGVEEAKQLLRDALRK